MLKRHCVICVLAVARMVLGADVVYSQNYPNKHIRMVTAEVGGGSDLAARLIAPTITDSLGQPVIVDNRGGGVTGAEIVAKAQPDGYTLLFYGNTIWISPLLRSNLPYDPVKDFSPISLTTSAPNILVVHPSMAANSVKELIAVAKGKSGGLNYASGASGSSPHLAAELFKAMAGVNIVRIPYKGSGPAIIDLIAGQVQMMFASVGGVAPHIKSGRLKALAVTSAEPSALLPGLPTVASSGLPGYESASMTGIFAPAKIPKTVVTRLNQEIVQALYRPVLKEKFLNAGVDVVGSSPENFAATIKSEMTRLGKVIKDAGIREE